MEGHRVKIYFKNGRTQKISFKGEFEDTKKWAKRMPGIRKVEQIEKEKRRKRQNGFQLLSLSGRRIV